MQTPIFHITHVDNLPGILAAGGLWCDRLRGEKAPGAVSIAHQHIKDRRAKRAVQTLGGRAVAAGGTLWDYVPFYFAPRSPMLFTVHRGNVQGYTGGQKSIVHLVSHVEAAVQLERAWCFTDGHAEIGYSEFYDDLADLDKLDWPLMKAQMWGGDDEKRRRRQAEFLVHEFVPITAFAGVGVMDVDARQRTEYALQRAGVSLLVKEKPEWYY